ncbi:hypothetical protein Tco_0206020 [Tanacetum coccineum]
MCLKKIPRNGINQNCGEVMEYQIDIKWVIGERERSRCALDANFHESIEDEEVSLVDGVLEGALGALGDEN